MNKKIEFVDLEEGMSEERFSLAIQRLIARGLLEEVMIDGRIGYRLTELGRSVGTHIHSDEKDRN